MNPKKVRQRIREFIERHLRIDEWGLNFPAQIKDPNLPTSIARENPATNDLQVEGYFSGMGSPIPLLGSLKLSYTIMFRFDAAYQYHQLPRADAERLVLRMNSSLHQAPECLDEEFREIDFGGSVSVAEVENKDWLIIYQLSFEPTFEVEPEDLSDLGASLMQKEPDGLPDLIPVVNPEENRILIPFFWADTSPKPIFRASAGMLIATAQIVIIEPLNGTDPVMSLGDTDLSTRLIHPDQVDPLEVGEWEANPNYTYPVESQILLFIEPGAGCTAGNGYVLLEIENWETIPGSF